MAEAAIRRRARTVRVGEVPVAGTLLAHGWESPALFAITMVLVLIGLVAVYSASAVMAVADGLPDYHYVVRQLTGAAVGFVVLGAFASLDYRRLRQYAWPALWVLIAVLVVMLLPGTEAIAPYIKGARRWVNIGPLVLQPSEFAKLVLIIWTAALTVKKHDKLTSLRRGLAPFLIVWAVVGGLVMFQPSMSAAGLIVLFAALTAFAGGARVGHFIFIGAIVLPFLWLQIQRVGYRVSRITSFFDPNYDPTGASYQINQALIAVGSGGVWGRGLGHGLQKYGFVPEPHNDFLLAMIGEEWGFLGVLVVIALFGVFTLIGFRIARDADDQFGSLLAIGITSMIAIHALMHMLINVAWFPTTGVTLPLMSYGRSSLLVCLAGIGILMNIARRRGASV